MTSSPDVRFTPESGHSTLSWNGPRFKRSTGRSRILQRSSTIRLVGNPFPDRVCYPSPLFLMRIGLDKSR